MWKSYRHTRGVTPLFVAASFTDYQSQAVEFKALIAGRLQRFACFSSPFPRTCDQEASSAPQGKQKCLCKSMYIHACLSLAHSLYIRDSVC
jgi:hypothetical protein